MGRARTTSQVNRGAPLPLVSAFELRNRASAPLLTSDGRIEDPVLLVDLDARPDDRVVEDAARAADDTAGNRVLVGVARDGAPAPGWEPLIRALDVTVAPGDDPSPTEVVGVLDPDATARAVLAAVHANPAASTSLAALLRWSGTLEVPAAIDAESTTYSTLLGGPEFAAWLAHRGARPLPPPAPAEPVLLQREGDELSITLNRPERRNAYGRQLRDALVAALELVAADESLVRVRLEGAGPSFCSGGDLDEFGTTPDLVTAHLVRTRAGAALPLHRVRDRVEVRLHGACVGAGIEMPAFAHRIVAAQDSRIRLPEIGMGLIPGAGGTVSIPRRIGRWRTLYLALSSTYLDARTALAWGLVDEVLPSSSEPG